MSNQSSKLSFLLKILADQIQLFRLTYASREHDAPELWKSRSEFLELPDRVNHYEKDIDVPPSKTVLLLQAVADQVEQYERWLKAVVKNNSQLNVVRTIGSSEYIYKCYGELVKYGRDQNWDKE